MSKLKYFIGKPCTIFTVNLNRNFKDENPATFVEQIYNYFFGIVEDADAEGIWIRQISNNKRSFFAKNYIVSIAEETMLDPERNADLINQIKQSTQPLKEVYKDSGSEYINTDTLSALLESARSK